MLSKIENDCEKEESLSGSLSQLLTGDDKMKNEVRIQIAKYITDLHEKVSRGEVKTEEEKHLLRILKNPSVDPLEQMLHVVSILFRCKIVLFTKISQTKYRVMKTNKDETFGFEYTMYFHRSENHFSAMKIVRTNKNGKQFKIEKILSHKSLMKLSNGAMFCVKWEDYGPEHNTMEPWDGLFETEALETYVNALKTRMHGAKQAKIALEEREKTVKQRYGVHIPDPNYNKKRYRKSWTFGLKKNFTGKKMKVASDILNLKGKGGCYCIMPHERIDDNSKALFKIGMSLDFTSRIDEYHTYFPEGVFHVAFLCDPTVEEWSENEKKEWKEKWMKATKNKKLQVTPKDVIKAMKTQKYKEIEKYIFEYVANNNGQRLHSTVNVRHPDPITKKGETEWFYTDDSLVHEAFTSAEEKYGGEKLLFSLGGLDPETGELIESINVIAEKKLKTLPHYSGSITYQI